MNNEILLDVPNEFDFAENLRYLANASNECMYRVKGKRLYKVISIGDEVPVVEIRADDEKTIIIRFLGNTELSCEEGRASVARYVKDWFDLDTDLRPFYDLAAT